MEEDMKKFYIFTGLAFLIGIASFAVNYKQKVFLTSTNSSFSYIDLTPEEQMKIADTIAVGTITEISHTLWNQDNGEYWEDRVQASGLDYMETALPYFTVQLNVEEFLLNGRDLNDDQLTITILGHSPLDQESDQDGLLFTTNDKVVVMGLHTEMAWKNGQKPIFKLLTEPNNSVYRQGADGLYLLGHERKGLQISETQKGLSIWYEGLSIEDIAAKVNQAN